MSILFQDTDAGEGPALQTRRDEQQSTSKRCSPSCQHLLRCLVTQMSTEFQEWCLLGAPGGNDLVNNAKWFYM